MKILDLIKNLLGISKSSPASDFKKKSVPQTNVDRFENAFITRLGKSPVDFICTKLSVGTDESAVEYLYDIIAAEIARKNNCAPIPFDGYYTTALAKINFKQRPFVPQPRQNIESKIKICQREFLNNVDGRPFGGMCARQMDLLYCNNDICSVIMQIGLKYHNIEFCEEASDPEFIKFKRETIPQEMKKTGIFENPIVQSICDYVIRSGKSRNSAFITIYYAIRCYNLKKSAR